MNAAAALSVPLRTSRIARIEWLLLLAATFPIPFALPLLFLGTRYPGLAIPAALQSLLEIAGLSLFIAVCGLLIDGIRGLVSPRADPPPHAAQRKLQDLFVEIFGARALPLAKSVRVIASDFSMGAHVRGVFKPRLIISGGLLVALQRREPAAINIVAHELAHIQHIDRLLPALIGMIAVEYIGRVAKFSFQAGPELDVAEFGMMFIFLVIYQSVVMGVLLSKVSKYREYYADARAMQLSRDPQGYIQLLENSPRHGGALSRFFHPSLDDRRAAAANGYVVLQRAWFWKVYWVLAATVSYLQWRSEELEGNDVLYAFCVAIVASACFVLDFLRAPLLSKASIVGPPFTTRVFPRWATSKWFLKSAYWIGGVLLVIFVCESIGVRDKSTGLAVGWGVLLFVSRLVNWDSLGADT